MRTRLMVGDDNVQRLSRAHVIVVGIGGVGAYAAEMLCRAGVGELTLVDGDVVSDSNRNRQLVALSSTVGQPKTEVLAARLRDINPEVKLHLFAEYLCDERIPEVLQAAHYDFLVDAIDTLGPKVYLLKTAHDMKIPLVSCMGSGGKIDPAQVKIADISQTTYCRLARMVRKRLSSMGIRRGVAVVFSPECVPELCIQPVDNEQNKRSCVGTISYMPAVFGCFLASHVVRRLMQPRCA